MTKRELRIRNIIKAYKLLHIAKDIMYKSVIVRKNTKLIALFFDGNLYSIKIFKSGKHILITKFRNNDKIKYEAVHYNDLL